MKVRLRIEALAIEADWPRAGRADFAEALRAALETELAAAARRGGFGPAGAGPRRRLTIPAVALAAPQAAGSSLARAISGEIAPGGPAGAGAASGRGRPR